MRKVISSRPAIRSIVSAIAALLLVSLPLAAQTPTPKVQKHGSDAVTLESLAQQASVIAAGRVSGTRSEWIDNKARIQTRVTIAVDRAYKGASAGSTLTVVVPGGEVDGVGETYSHTDRFLRDEEVIVFLSPDSKGEFRLPPGQRGKLAIVTDKTTGRKYVPNVGTLDEVSVRIARSINSGDAGQK